jgi:hypothetical protein
MVAGSGIKFNKLKPGLGRSGNLGKKFRAKPGEFLAKAKEGPLLSFLKKYFPPCTSPHASIMIFPPG